MVRRTNAATSGTATTTSAWPSFSTQTWWTLWPSARLTRSCFSRPATTPPSRCGARPAWCAWPSPCRGHPDLATSSPLCSAAGPPTWTPASMASPDEAMEQASERDRELWEDLGDSHSRRGPGDEPLTPSTSLPLTPLPNPFLPHSLSRPLPPPFSFLQRPMGTWRTTAGLRHHEAHSEQLSSNCQREGGDGAGAGGRQSGMAGLTGSLGDINLLTGVVWKRREVPERPSRPWNDFMQRKQKLWIEYRKMNHVFCLKDRLGENKVLEVRRKRKWCNDAMRDGHGWEMCVVDHFCVFTYAGFKSLTIQQCWPPLMSTRVHECTLYCYTFRFVLQFVLLLFVFSILKCVTAQRNHAQDERGETQDEYCV